MHYAKYAKQIMSYNFYETSSSHFIDKETEAHNGLVICPNLNIYWVMEM